MKASTEVTIETARRRRYVRQPTAQPLSMTPLRLQLLYYVGELQIASRPQLAALACPSQKSARRHLRELFDAGLVDVIPVARIALATGGDPMLAGSDPSLLYGSAPNLFTLTPRGEEVLRSHAGWNGTVPPGRYGPVNSYFLAHELEIRDVRVWIECAARKAGNELIAWRHGPAAEIAIVNPATPLTVRPDAWFSYRFGKGVLVGLVEVDRGTERGNTRWREKLAGYSQLLLHQESLWRATQHRKARVLVTTPTARRRDQLADLIYSATPPEIARRFWITVRGSLQEHRLSQSVWRQPGAQSLGVLLDDR